MLRSIPGGQPEGREPVNVDALFRLVLGQERAKLGLRYALMADKPVHILLTGPPGTAKTLLLEDIARLPNAFMYSGATTTKAGLNAFLLRVQPDYLIIDELGLMERDDFSPLLGLQESGSVSELKFKRQSNVVLQTRVFAATNDTRRIPAANLSRFLPVPVPAYSRGEFLSVAEAVLNQQEGLSIIIARLIAHEVVGYSMNIRDAKFVGRMVKGQLKSTPANEVGELVATITRTVLAQAENPLRVLGRE